MKSRQSPLGLGCQLPPDERHVRIYFLQQGSTVEEATEFYRFYQKKGWETKNGRIHKNWKMIAWIWIWYPRV